MNDDALLVDIPVESMAADEIEYDRPYPYGCVDDDDVPSPDRPPATFLPPDHPKRRLVMSVVGGEAPGIGIGTGTGGGSRPAGECQGKAGWQPRGGTVGDAGGDQNAAVSGHDGAQRVGGWTSDGRLHHAGFTYRWGGLRPYRLRSSRQETSGCRPATCRALRRVALMMFWHCGGWGSGRRGDVGRFARSGIGQDDDRHRRESLW